MTPSFRALSFHYVNLCNHVLVLQFKRGEISYYQIKGEVMKDENILDKKQMLFGFLVCIQVIPLLADGTIAKTYPESFC